MFKEKFEFKNEERSLVGEKLNESLHLKLSSTDFGGHPDPSDKRIISLQCFLKKDELRLFEKFLHELKFCRKHFFGSFTFKCEDGMDLIWENTDRFSPLTGATYAHVFYFRLKSQKTGQVTSIQLTEKDTSEFTNFVLNFFPKEERLIFLKKEIKNLNYSNEVLDQISFLFNLSPWGILKTFNLELKEESLNKTFIFRSMFMENILELKKELFPEKETNFILPSEIFLHSKKARNLKISPEQAAKIKKSQMLHRYENKNGFYYPKSKY